MPLREFVPTGRLNGGGGGGGVEMGVEKSSKDWCFKNAVNRNVPRMNEMRKKMQVDILPWKRIFSGVGTGRVPYRKMVDV